MATIIDLHNYALTPTSSPWYNSFGNPSIIDPHINITWVDYVVRDILDLDVTSWSASYEISFVEGFEVELACSIVNMWNGGNAIYPVIKWEADQASLHGVWGGGVTPFGGWSGQNISNGTGPFQVTLFVNVTNRTIRVVCDGQDTGIIQITNMAVTNEHFRRMAFGTGLLGDVNDTLASKIGTVTIETSNIIETSNLTLPTLNVNGTGIVEQTETSVLDTLTSNNDQITNNWAYDMAKKTITKGDCFDEDVINLSIENILSTFNGERIFQPEFGTILPRVLFEQLNQSSANDLLNVILRAIRRYEKRITLVREQIQMNILTEENAFTIVIPYIINRNGLIGTFSKKVIL